MARITRMNTAQRRRNQHGAPVSNRLCVSARPNPAFRPRLGKILVFSLPMNPPPVAASRESAAIVETQSAALSRDAATARFMGSKREISFGGILSPIWGGLGEGVPRSMAPTRVKNLTVSPSLIRSQQGRASVLASRRTSSPARFQLRLRHQTRAPRSRTAPGRPARRIRRVAASWFWVMVMRSLLTGRSARPLTKTP